jgi:hypothetical protein
MLPAGVGHWSEPQDVITMRRLDWPEEGTTNTMKRMVLWVIELRQHVMPHGFLCTFVYIFFTCLLSVGMHTMQVLHEGHPSMHTWLQDRTSQPILTCMPSWSSASDTGSTSFLTNSYRCLLARRRQALAALSESAWPVAANAEYTKQKPSPSAGFTQTSDDRDGRS